MVNGTAEEQFRIRARRALEAGEPYAARGEKNKAILEEIREEVKRACKQVQAAAHAGQEAVRRQTRKGTAEMKEAIAQATAQGKREIEDVVLNATKRLKSLALEAPGESSAASGAASSAASSASEVVTTLAPTSPPSENEEEDLPPTDPEELGEWKKEKEQEREWEAARPAREEATRALRAEGQARRAAEKLATMQGLPALPDEMPQWFQANVQCYYGRTPFLRAVEAGQRPLREAAEEQMMQKRKKCRQCREEGHRPRGYMCKYSCHEHWQPEEPDARALALIEERLRDEYAGEAASDALEWKAAEDRRKEQQRVDEAMVQEEEAARERLAKDAIRLLAPECLKCVDCQEEGFSSRVSMINVISAHSCLVMMCDAHAKACELVQARALRC